jgi:hypothetical protein
MSEDLISKTEAEEFIKRMSEDGKLGEVLEAVVKEKTTYSPITAELIIGWQEEPIDFTINEKGELSAKAEGDEEPIVINPRQKVSRKVFKDAEILGKLPKIDFDMNRGGNISEQKEAQSIYIVSVLNRVLGKPYETEILELLEGYDFETLKGPTKDLPFRSFLTALQETAPPVVKFLIAICQLKILGEDTKKELQLRSHLDKKVVQELEALEMSISTATKEFDKVINNSSESIEKHVRLKNMNEKDLKIEGILSEYEIKAPRAVLAFRVLKQKVDRVPTLLQINIAREAKSEVKELCKKHGITDKGNIEKMNSKLRRRAMREALRNMKTMQLKDITANNYENLFPKA